MVECGNEDEEEREVAGRRAQTSLCAGDDEREIIHKV